MRLTRPNVARVVVPPGKTEIIVFDEALPGFGVRVRLGGKRTWIAQYRLGSKQRRVTLGTPNTLELRGGSPPSKVSPRRGSQWR